MLGIIKSSLKCFILSSNDFGGIAIDWGYLAGETPFFTLGTTISLLLGTMSDYLVL